MLLGLFATGVAFGAAIETITGKRYHLPIAGIFVWPAILLIAYLLTNVARFFIWPGILLLCDWVRRWF